MGRTSGNQIGMDSLDFSDQDDPLQSLAGSQEDEPPDVETPVTWHKAAPKKSWKLVKSDQPMWVPGYKGYVFIP